MAERHDLPVVVTPENAYAYLQNLALGNYPDLFVEIDVPKE